MKKSLILILIIIIALFSVGGYFIYENYFVIYKTYKNNEHGFEFTYPQRTWHIFKKINSSGPIVAIYYYGSFSESYMGAAPVSSFVVSKIKDTELSDLQSGKLKTDSGWNSDLNIPAERVIYNQEKNIAIRMNAINLEKREVEEQMLSTFKFTK